MNVEEYKKKFISLLVKERQKILLDLKNFKNKSSLNHLKVLDLNTKGTKILIKLKLNKETDIFSLKVGESYLIYSKGGDEEDITGVLIHFSQTEIMLSVDRVKNYLYSETLNLCKSMNDTTYNRMIKVLEHLDSVSSSAVKIRDILIGNDKSVNWNDTKEIAYFDNNLNDSQEQAVLNSLNESSFFLVQGPPGTGKTRVAKELILQFLKQNKKILVCCDSNLAVDNILKQFDLKNNFLRLGQNYKFDESIKPFTFDFKQTLDARHTLILTLLEDVSKYRNNKQKYLMPSKELSKELNYLQICKFADSGNGFNDLDNETLTSMRNWIVVHNKMRKCFIQIDKLKHEILSDLLKTHKVIFSTNVNSFDINNIMFDVCIIDEASQATQPSVLIPAMRAKKVILIGDHKQLPPTTGLPDSDLMISFFEKLIEKSSFTTLDTQYRMHKDICNFISKTFYSSKLKTQVDVELDNTYIFDKHMVFININGSEKIVSHSRSKINEFEANKIIELIKQYNESGFNLDDIGIISPYLDQCHLIKNKLHENKLTVKVNTVDSYQGSQKNIIILSLVRNNKKGDLGFLKDLRRLNVSISRAINQLVILGNEKTISNLTVYKDLIDYIKKNGIYFK